MFKTFFLSNFITEKHLILLKFHNREAFNTALSVLMKKYCDGYFVDVDDAYMIFSFDSNSVLQDFVTKLPFSSEYFTINQ